LPWTKAKTTRELGSVTEQFAEKHLTQQGLTIIDKNFHCRQGEIDLIMQEDETLVFVEVKYRKSNTYGGAIAAVSFAKQKKIKYCAAFFLHKAQLNEYNTPCRFDVIALEGDINNPKVTWLKNAF